MRRERGRDSGGDHGGGTGGYGGTLPAKEEEVGEGTADVGDGKEGESGRSRTDYILGTDRSLFRNVAVRDPRYNSDHYMVMGLLRGRTGRGHAKYIAGRRKIPLKPPRRPTREDEFFGDLRRAVPKTQPREQHRNAWISEETWRLVDKRVTMQRKTRARTGLQRLGRAIQASRKGDRKRRVEEAGRR